MTERVKMLRQQSLDAKPVLSPERAILITQFYRGCSAESAPMRRALAFKHLMENKTIYIGDGELIVGEKGPAPKATPTFPELCCHSLDDLHMLHTREKVSFPVDDETRRVYEEEIIPFWRGKSLRDRIFREVPEEWKAAYDAGIFTEFMEQRAPGHTVAGDKVFRKGFLDYKAEIEESISKLDFYNDREAYEKRDQLHAMSICCDALIRFAERHAEKARELAESEADPDRRKELARIAEVCTRVPAHAPHSFWEALQMYWFVHLGITTELNTWDSFSPGRLDQHLEPFYTAGLEQGTLTEEKAKELLQCFWVKFNNQPAPPKVGVTAAESGTYTDFANIGLGGMRRDGSDGVNEVTYLLLDVVDEMRIVQPSTNVQISKKSPDRFVKCAARVIRRGWGQPSVFNADEVVEELLRQGKSVEDARCGGTSGCVETGAFGKESYILTGYFNLPKVLEIALNDGIDPRTGRRIGAATGDAKGFRSYQELFDAFKAQVKHFIDIKVKGSNIIERIYADHMPAPFMSIVIDDCIKNGKDYNCGGARYNTNYIQGVGIGSITDSLSAIRWLVWEDKRLDMPELLEALQENFEGREHIRQTMINKPPKYGNDHDFADDIMRSVFDVFYDAVNGRPTTKGGVYRINMLPTTCHIYFGSVTGALPDGRRAWQPLSEGISPVQGADRRGPTAVLRSAAKMDHVRTGGTLLNMKFTPQILDGDEGIDSLTHLIRTYFRLDGHHIQFNVVTADTLREAQREPEKYRDLIVRVAGYSDYFCDLGRSLQDEIIARTEHGTL
jgi:pyruvate formate-lyase/glycerol dehydratase family glycyl radical enzyme